jgi:hypothetical protein
LPAQLPVIVRMASDWTGRLRVQRSGADPRTRPVGASSATSNSLPTRLSAARGPPQPALDFDADPLTPLEDPLPADDFDQTPTFDPVDPEPVPGLDLDPTRGA